MLIYVYNNMFAGLYLIKESIDPIDLSAIQLVRKDKSIQSYTYKYVFHRYCGEQEMSFIM